MGRKQQQRAIERKKLEEEIAEIFKRAEQGDEKALAVMREVDGISSLCNAYGDIGRMAEDSLVNVFTKNPLVKEALRFKLNALRKEILGPDPSPLEDLLARRIAACWLHLHHLETIYAQNIENNGLSGRWSESMQRSIDRAQRRYLAAIKALVQVRRLLVPMVQVNIAEKQLNIAQLTHSK